MTKLFPTNVTSERFHTSVFSLVYFEIAGR